MILTLAFLVLLSAVVLAFFSRAMTTRQVSYSSAGQVRAEQVAGTALWTITADMIDEMRAGSENPDARPGDLFQPANADLSRPFRSPVNPDITNLISGSFRGQPLWQGGAYDFTGPIRVYDDGANSTLQPSANNRFVRNSRWRMPRLHDDDIQFEAGFTPPGWVYVTREGPVTVEPEGPDFEEWGDRQPGNDDYVVGRFAYMIYDVGGLLDINLAGAREELLPTGMAARGSHQAFADLALIQGEGEIDTDALVNWRHAGSIAAGQYADIYEGMDWDFRRPWPGDQMLLTRQDLLAGIDSIAREMGAPPTAQPLSLLPKLTVFSRTKNAPYRQALGIDRAGNPAPVDNSFNPHPLDIRVLDEFTRRDGTTARVGEPLIKSRFPLSKLALLDGINSTSGELAGDTERLAEIRDYFGLIPHGDGYSWQYDPELTFSDGTGFGIRTLAEVAQQDREPNFFEMLQAGILQGSLGSASASDTVIMTSVYDANTTYQVLQIGANLIDQYDSDDMPTSIIFPSSVDPVQIFGLENLPYIYAIGSAITRPMVGGTPWQNSDMTRVGGWFQFALWNPTQNAQDPGGQLLRLGAVSGSADLQLQQIVVPDPESEERQTVSLAPGPTERGTFTGEPSYLLFFNGPAPSSPQNPHLPYTPFRELNWLDRPDDGSTRSGEVWVSPPQSTPENTTRFREGVISRDRNRDELEIIDIHAFAGIFLTHVEAPEQWIPPREFNEYIEYLNAFEEQHGQVDDELWHPIQDSYLDDGVRRHPPRDFFYPMGWLENRIEEELNGQPNQLGDRRIPDVANAFHREGRIIPALDDPLVFELQIEHPSGSGQFRPYQRIDGMIGETALTRHYQSRPWYFFSLYRTSAGGRGASIAHSGYANFDPRSMRYGMFQMGNVRQMLPGRLIPRNLPDYSSTRGTDQTSGVSDIGDKYERFAIPTASNPQPGGPNWVRTGGSLNPGALTDNTDTPTWEHSDHNTYVIDPDGVLRRADGTHRSDRTGSSPHVGIDIDERPGLPDRPLILNRPFETVADMGYAFRDQPWKNLNFFRRESADLGLLDFFSVEEGDVLAGRIDMNTPHSDVLAAILSGGGFMERNPENTIDAPMAENVAQLIASEGPFEGFDRLVQLLDGQDFMPDPPHKAEHEAVIRRLSNVAQARTWNVMVDVVAQAGRFPTASEDFDDFVVEGERRYWVHLAIDRYTGEVIDYLVEGVSE